MQTHTHTDVKLQQLKLLKCQWPRIPACASKLFTFFPLLLLIFAIRFSTFPKCLVLINNLKKKGIIGHQAGTIYVPLYAITILT